MPPTPARSTKTRHIRSVVRAVGKGKASPKSKSPLQKREKEKGFTEEMSREIVTFLIGAARALGMKEGASKLPKGTHDLAIDEFQRYNLTSKKISRLWKTFMESRDEGMPLVKMKFNMREGRPATNTQFTEHLARKLIEINDKHWGRLSMKKLTGKFLEATGVDVHEDTVTRWCRALGMQRKHLYIKPMLTREHKMGRLGFVLGKVHEAEFLRQYDIVHVDEKWFYLMHDGSVCRVFPDANGEVRIPNPPRVRHKSHIPKLMFLATIAEPRPEYGFDGKVGIWFFGEERLAKRSNSKTGLKAGVSKILDCVGVNAEEYRKVMIGAGGVFDKIRDKFWWHKPNSGKPEAGTPVFIQQDGARPHTKENATAWVENRSKDEITITVTTQPAQSPDVNTNDLDFFASLQDDVTCAAKKDTFELKAVVEQAFAKYQSERLARCFRQLYTSYHRILETFGDNNYNRHRGDRKRRRSGLEADCAITSSVLRAARSALARFQRGEDPTASASRAPQDPPATAAATSASDASSDSEESDDEP